MIMDYLLQLQRNGNEIELKLCDKQRASEMEKGSVIQYAQLGSETSAEQSLLEDVAENMEYTYFDTEMSDFETNLPSCSGLNESLACHSKNIFISLRRAFANFESANDPQVSGVIVGLSCFFCIFLLRIWHLKLVQY